MAIDSFFVMVYQILLLIFIFFSSIRTMDNEFFTFKNTLDQTLIKVLPERCKEYKLNSDDKRYVLRPQTKKLPPFTPPTKLPSFTPPTKLPPFTPPTDTPPTELPSFTPPTKLPSFTPPTELSFEKEDTEETKENQCTFTISTNTLYLNTLYLKISQPFPKTWTFIPSNNFENLSLAGDHAYQTLSSGVLDVLRSQIKNLQLIAINDKKQIKITTDICPSLVSLQIKTFKDTETVDLSEHKNIRSLSIYDCEKLTQIILPPQLKVLRLKKIAALKEITFKENNSLIKTLDLNMLDNKTFDLDTFLEKIDAQLLSFLELRNVVISSIISNFSNLETIILNTVNFTENNLDLSKMENLKTLQIENNYNPSTQKAHNTRKSPENIIFNKKSKLKKIYLEKLTTLKSLEISTVSDDEISTVSDDHETFLRVFDCHNLETITTPLFYFFELSNLQNLKVLNLLEKTLQSLELKYNAKSNALEAERYKAFLINLCPQVKIKLENQQEKPLWTFDKVYVKNMWIKRILATGVITATVIGSILFYNKFKHFQSIVSSVIEKIKQKIK